MSHVVHGVAHPADQGFDPIAWYDGGGSIYFNWRENWNNRSKNHFPEMPQEEWMMGDAGEETGEDYLSDDLTIQALNYLDERSKIKDQAFFLYFNHLEKEIKNRMFVFKLTYFTKFGFLTF